MNRDPSADLNSSAPSRLRVWVFDDQRTFRLLLAEFLGGHPDFHVVGAGDGEEPFFAAVERGEVDAVVLDLNLPGAGGFVIAQRLQQRQAPVAVLILSAQATVHSLAMARRLGVAGYLQKTAPLDELVLALKQLSQGGTYFGSGLARLADAAGEGMADARTAGGLAEREVDLMLGLTRGESVSALSRQLACARSEIYRSRTQLMNRIQARNPGEFLAYVASIGLAANASGAHDSALLSP